MIHSEEGRGSAPWSMLRRPAAQHPEAGLTTGTRLWTADGDIPVEFLNAGDRIVTRNAGMVRLVAVTRHAEEAPAVLIRAGALGRARPDGDLVLPAGQRVLVRDRRAQAMFGAVQAMVAAGTLVDDEFIVELGVRPMQLHRLHFDRPRLIYAGGLEVSGSVIEADTLGNAA